MAVIVTGLILVPFGYCFASSYIDVPLFLFIIVTEKLKILWTITNDIQYIQLLYYISLILCDTYVIVLPLDGSNYKYQMGHPYIFHVILESLEEKFWHTTNTGAAE